ncbi:CEL6 protein [Punctularia strigosozonata HHB-11173 SS5]|uniref:CEL6 protein n=1 Tax=Punctularia strigosozonata (strain HHB-11173) TaxID=741275 RepID=R7S0U7_PUNST|nr:CEL6 protein [Punctularia strigosozonata HHB-11173 SS5]EIN03833.1 CEL6 protein [Punctularia strigosozonata HHB-11173 SS5]
MMFTAALLSVAPLAFAALVDAIVTQGSYTWKNVKIGGGGGFVPNIVFNTEEKGLAYARTDIGGVYRLNPDDSWTPLTDFANDTYWGFWGSDALATDPVDPNNLYIATGMYTNSWDPNNGHILKSTNRGASFTAFPLPFKVGGNDPGRGMGERLAIDPNNNKILFFGARSGHGLWKSTNSGETWTNVTSFPSVGTYVQDPTDPSGLGSDIMGIAWVTFDHVSADSKTSTGSKRIFVGVANMGADNVFVSEDAGVTWKAVSGQNSTFIPHHGVLSPKEGPALYLPYANGIGPYDGTAGYVKKYFINNSTWVDITPAQGIADNAYGYGGLSVDLQRPGTVMVAPLNEWYPDADIYRSTDGGNSWTGLFTTSYPPPDYQLFVNRSYNYDVSKAPWITTFATGDTKHIGWMIEGLSIDPFDSNHWLYGTGLTLYGGHDLLNWDAAPRKNVTVASLADGIEETAVQGLSAPLSGPLLLSAVGDVGSFRHTSLTTPPTENANPIWAGTASDVDYAGGAPSNLVRLAGIAGQPIATSNDSGVTWTPLSTASSTASGGKIAISADGSTIVWSQASGLSGPQYSANGGAFAAPAGLPSSALVVADKLNTSVFYAISGKSFYVSADGAKTFTQTSTLGTAQSSTAIAASPFKAGELFVSTSAGVFHSTDFGKTLTSIPGATNAWDIAVGVPKTKSARTPPVLFASATISGVNSVYRTDDLGANWVKVADVAHGFGSASGLVLAADARVYGRVFVGTNGRGIFYGEV